MLKNNPFFLWYHILDLTGVESVFLKGSTFTGEARMIEGIYMSQGSRSHFKFREPDQGMEVENVDLHKKDYLTNSMLRRTKLEIRKHQSSTKRPFKKIVERHHIFAPLQNLLLAAVTIVRWAHFYLRSFDAIVRNGNNLPPLQFPTEARWSWQSILIFQSKHICCAACLLRKAKGLNSSVFFWSIARFYCVVSR